MINRYKFIPQDDRCSYKKSLSYFFLKKNELNFKFEDLNISKWMIWSIYFYYQKSFTGLLNGSGIP